MQSIHATTPFGRRPASLGLIAGNIARREAMAAARAPGSNAPAAVNKWSLFRAVTAARAPLGLSDRTLTLLNALLSFHPEVALSLPAASDASQGRGQSDADPSCDLVVFPSNRALSARAHGMAEKTIRRHLVALVEAGLITRRDSPNGKRYARRIRDDDAAEQRPGHASGRADRFADGFADVYGFDITPLVLRAGEIEAMAEAERQKTLAIRRLCGRVTILRRDIGKWLDLAQDEGLAGPFGDYRLLLAPLMTPLRRIGADLDTLERLTGALAALRDDVMQACEDALNPQKMTGNDGENDRHQSSSNEDAIHDLEPSPPDIRGEAGAPTEAVPHREGSGTDDAALPLGMVLAACPDVALFADGGRIASWRDLAATLRNIRPMLGISPDAFRDAVEVMGESTALLAIATILQRSEHSSEAERSPGGPGVTVNGSPAIRSAGGYLRALTEDARAGRFRLGPVLMALIGQRQKRKGLA